MTDVLSEAVVESDIYRLALDGHLTLSVNFVNHAEAHRGKLIPIAQAKRVQGIPSPPKYEYHEVTLGIPYGDDQIIQFEIEEDEKNIVTLAGVFDLPMIGAEAIDIEDRFQMLTGGVSVDLINMDGTFVVSQDGAVFFSILEELTPQKLDRKNGYKITPATHMPANGLPDDSVLVVRTDSLNEFLKSMKSEQDRITTIDQVKPLGTRERDTLLSVIAALCKEAKLDYTKPAKTAGLIQSTAAGMGISIGETTIENHLKKIPNALATRTR